MLSAIIQPMSQQKADAVGMDVLHVSLHLAHAPDHYVNL